MSKKIMLLALAAVTAAVVALPSMASALVPLHLVPKPEGAQTIDTDPGIEPVLVAGGFQVKCATVHGTATFTSTTGGTLDLTFGTDCKGPLGVTCTSTNPVEPSGSIRTTALPFDLVTVGTAPNNKPGVLVTPGEGGAFAHFSCAGIQTTIEGNGVIGTITNRACGDKSNDATIDFNVVGGVQEHKKVTGTETVYELKKEGSAATQDAAGTLTLTKEATLECT